MAGACLLGYPLSHQSCLFPNALKPPPVLITLYHLKFTGCWLIYKVIDDQMCDLESYDLTSANDAPERDPMDW